jgi:uncharacterized protein YkwD
MTIVKSKTKLHKSGATKKRYGEHHKTNSHHYLKTYWPYLPMLMIIGICLLANNLLVIHPSVLGATSDLSNQSFLSDTNQQRIADKEPALNLNQQLSNAAQAKANDMVKLNFWSHNSPTGETPWQYITNSGYSYQQAGENLAYGFSSATEVTSAWMNSPEHRQNILNSSFTDVGFGVASSTNYLNKGTETVVVAEYAEPAPTNTVANISFNVNQPGAVKGASAVKTYAPNASLVSRIQVLTGQASWILLIAAFITGILVCYFVYRNFKRIKRIFKDGEKFAAHHVLLDLLLVIVIGAGYLLTRTSGFIH